PRASGVSLPGKGVPGSWGRYRRKVASDGLTGVLGVAALPGVAASGRRSKCTRERAAAPGSVTARERQRWTITVVPAQVATTALDHYCRSDDSTRYFAVVGRRARSQPSAEVISPKPLKPADVEPPGRAARPAVEAQMHIPGPLDS